VPTAGSDLRAAMAARQSELAAAESRVDPISTNCGFFFANHDNERVCVSMECFEPAVGAAHGRGR
jgi:hypothetical protein